MARIVAIGGGEFKTLGTLAIDKQIVAMAGKPRPRVLFIPTASQESGGYITSFRHVYGKNLGCKTEPLMLEKGEPKSPEKVRDKIMASDIIYVGSGNTRYMLEVWRRFSVADALRQAAEAGKVLCGLSAGAVCWFEASWSDYPLLEGTGSYRMLPALGILPGVVCPHSDEPGRTDGLDEVLKKEKRQALCLPNYGALVVDGARFYQLRSQPQARVTVLDGDGHSRVLEEEGPLAGLWGRREPV